MLFGIASPTRALLLGHFRRCMLGGYGKVDDSSMGGCNAMLPSPEFANSIIAAHSRRGGILCVVRSAYAAKQISVPSIAVSGRESANVQVVQCFIWASAYVSRKAPSIGLILLRLPRLPSTTSNFDTPFSWSRCAE